MTEFKSTSKKKCNNGFEYEFCATLEKSGVYLLCVYCDEILDFSISTNIANSKENSVYFNHYISQKSSVIPIKINEINSEVIIKLYSNQEVDDARVILQSPSIFSYLQRKIYFFKKKFINKENISAPIKTLQAIEINVTNDAQLLKKTAIIIPTKNNNKMLEKLDNNILTEFRNKGGETIIISNNSDTKEMAILLEKLRSNGAKIIIENSDFNYSKLLNIGIESCDKEYIIVLNDDVYPTKLDELTYLIQLTSNKDIGIVGAKLLYANNSIQHAGIALGIGGIADHIARHMKNAPEKLPKELNMVCKTVAVTGALMVFKRDTWNSIGKFNENYTIECSDIEFCIQAEKSGLTNIVNNKAKIFHFESTTRKSAENNIQNLKIINNDRILFFQNNWLSMQKFQKLNFNYK